MSQQFTLWPWKLAAVSQKVWSNSAECALKKMAGRKLTKKKPFQNTVEILAKGDSVVVQVLGDKTTINGYTFDLTDPVQRAACEQYSDWLKNHRRDEIEALFGTKVDDSG